MKQTACCGFVLAMLLLCGCGRGADKGGPGDGDNKKPDVVVEGPGKKLPDALKDVEPGKIGEIRAIEIEFDSGAKVDPGGKGNPGLKLPKGFRLPSMTASQAEFLPDGRHLVVAAGNTVVWDLVSNKEVRQLGEAKMLRSSYVATTADGSLAFVPSGYDYTFRLVDVATGKDKKMFRAEQNEHIQEMAVTSSGKFVLAISAGGRGGVWLWELSTGLRVRDYKDKGAVHGVAVSPDEKWAVGAVGLLGRTVGKNDSGKIIISDCGLRVWDLETAKPVALLPSHDDVMHSVAFSPDGRYLAGGCGDGSIYLFETDGWKEVRKWPAHSGPVAVIAFSPDNRLIASGGGWDQVRSKSDGNVHVWKAPGGERVHTFRGSDKDVRKVRFSPDSRYLVGSGGNFEPVVRVWRLEN